MLAQSNNSGAFDPMDYYLENREIYGKSLLSIKRLISKNVRICAVNIRNVIFPSICTHVTTQEWLTAFT
jgi:hypothetical protein